MSSPTERSLKLMRSKGYYAEVVEKWNAFTKRRHDLFGFVDILCLGDGEVVGVQTTTSSNVASRLQKILSHENVAAVRRAGIRIVIHGWRKKGGRWECRELDVDQFASEVNDPLIKLADDLGPEQVPVLEREDDES